MIKNPPRFVPINWNGRTLKVIRIINDKELIQAKAAPSAQGAHGSPKKFVVLPAAFLAVYAHGRMDAAVKNLYLDVFDFIDAKQPHRTHDNPYHGEKGDTSPAGYRTTMDFPGVRQIEQAFAKRNDQDTWYNNRS